MMAPLLLVVSACARQNEIELTLAAQNATLREQMTDVFGTATIEADRLQVTLEYMGTRVRQAELQNEQLRATLVARGTDPAAIGNLDPNAVTLIPTSGTGNFPPGGITPAPDAQQAQGQSNPTVVVTPGTSNQPTLSNIVMASGVGSDDCAVNTTSTFSSTDPEIYVVATAINIQPGMQIASRWRVGGNEIVHDFTPNFAINGNCIWFFIDQADTPFTPGNWNVQLEINGTPVGSPVQFSISG